MCEFKIPYTGTATALIARIRKAIDDSPGGSFGGDEETGVFGLVTPLGNLGADYSIAGSVIGVSINKKPRIVPCRLIEIKVREYVAGTS